jgi:serine/threonine protein kinase
LIESSLFNRSASMPGKTLAHYEILEKLGEGGMGAVYLARDTKLDREVALKILPEQFAADPERLARFEREGKLLASLNHPNIASVYGLHHEPGDADQTGVHFLAMELAEGEDLSACLARGPLPVDEAIAAACQIAEALEAAHDAGVVHRDLKPANIHLNAAGKIKVLDFGLAKALNPSSSQASGDLAQSPTITTAAATAAGAILGTAAYMSPEQARGAPADHRADIWAFGAVLYEMLSGRRPFPGNSLADTLASVLKAEPDWSLLPAETPAPVHRVLRRCLAKDPGQRIHHIADARLELQALDPLPTEPDRRSKRNRTLIAVMSLALLVSLVFILRPVLVPGSSDSAKANDNPLAGARFSKITDFEGLEFDAAISPDGRFVAFVSDRDGPFEVYICQVGATGFRKLATDENVFGLEDALAPVRSVGFNGDGSEIWLGGGPGRRVRSIPLLGGPARNFLGEDAVTVAWSPDRTRIVYHYRTAGDPMFIADDNEAGIRQLVAPSAGVHQHYPVWSTDGQWIYFSRGRPSTHEMSLWRIGAEGQGLEQLTRNHLDVRYPTPIDANTVLYSARDADGAGPWLWAFDIPSGTSRRASVGLDQYTSLSASTDGRRLVASVHDSRSQLWSIPITDGTATEADAKPFADLGTNRALSPRFGGSSLFFLSSRGSGDGLWRYEGGRVTEIWRGSEAALLEPAAIAPRGDRVALVLRQDDGWRLHTMRADGTGLRLLTDAVDARGSAAWSPDGEWLVTGGFVGGVEGLYKIPVKGGPPERIAEGEALNPVWSPAGDLIVYTGPQVHVVSPLVGVRPDGALVELPTMEVFRWGERMRFLPDGTGMVYMQGNGPGQDFWLLDLGSLESRRLTRLDGANTMLTFDITPDGKEIVFDRLSEKSDIVLIELSDQGD